MLFIDVLFNSLFYVYDIYIFWFISVHMRGWLRRGWGRRAGTGPPLAADKRAIPVRLWSSARAHRWTTLFDDSAARPSLQPSLSPTAAPANTTLSAEVTRAPPALPATDERARRRNYASLQVRHLSTNYFHIFMGIRYLFGFIIITCARPAKWYLFPYSAINKNLRF